MIVLEKVSKTYDTGRFAVWKSAFGSRLSRCSCC
jgi:hypothetical protein